MCFGSLCGPWLSVSSRCQKREVPRTVHRSERSQRRRTMRHNAPRDEIPVLALNVNVGFDVFNVAVDLIPSRSFHCIHRSGVGHETPAPFISNSLPFLFFRAPFGVCLTQDTTKTRFCPESRPAAAPQNVVQSCNECLARTIDHPFDVVALIVLP